MKIFFFLISFCLSFSLQVRAQGDFDFQFYPSATYQKYFERFDLDTSALRAGVDSIPRTLKVDSTKTEVQVHVEKSAANLKVIDIRFPGAPLYDERVRFLGVIEDGIGSLLYESLGPDKEQIVINPVRGFVVISFKKCFDTTKDGKIIPWPSDQTKQEDPDYCNFINHNFGTVSVKKYRPSGL